MRKLFPIIALFFIVNHSFTIDYEIQTILISGNTRTKDRIILQELLFDEGNTYSEEEWERIAEQTEQALKNLGVLESAEITVTDLRSNPAPEADVIPIAVNVTVSDRWAAFPLPVYYFDNKLGNVFGFLIMDFNMLGLKQTVQLQGLYNPNFKETVLNWDYPRIAGSDYNLILKLSYKENFEYQYSGTDTVYEAWLRDFFVYGAVEKEIEKWEQLWTPYIDTEIDVRTNQIYINTVSKSPADGVTWSFGIGLRHGELNRDIGAVWGDDNNVRIGFTPRNLSFEAEFKHGKFFRIGKKSVFGYRLKGFVSPDVEVQMDSMLYIRGITLGDIRGNYGFYGNVEFRPMVLSLNFLGGLDFYTPVFFDFGNAFSDNAPFDLAETVTVAGAGLRIYSHKVGGEGICIRLDAGVNFAYLQAGKTFSDSFFVAFGVQEMIGAAE